MKISILFHYLVAVIKLRYAISMADDAYQKCNDRFFILPDSAIGLLIINRATFRDYKLKGYIDPAASVRALKRECFYFTPTRNGEEKLSDIDKRAKKQMWIDYYFKQKNIKIWK